jgi:Zn-dependent metalloprotease
LLILLLIMGACYWLFLSPIDLETGLPESGDEAVGGPTPVIDGELSATQEEAVSTLNQESQETLTILAPQGQIQYLTTRISVPDSIAVNPQAKALYFIKQNKDLFQLDDPGRCLKYEDQHTDNLGITHVRYTQQYQGVPVYGSSVVVDVNSDDEIITYNANYVPNLEIDVYPAVRSITAEETAFNDLGADDTEIFESTYLAIYAPEIWGDRDIEPRLAWFVSVESDTVSEAWIYIVDAEEGIVLKKIDMILDVGFDLSIWEKNNNLLEQVYTETGAVSGTNPTHYSQNAYNHSKTIYDYYSNTFDRDGYDNSGSMLEVTVEISSCSATASWNNSSKQMYFCRDWTTPLDVFSHEYTHAVIGSEVAFNDFGEPRELNEAFSDIFASFIDDTPWELNQPRDSDGVTIVRNQADPQEGYPRHYDERYCDPDKLLCLNECPGRIGTYIERYKDCGHINSMVFSHAAYLMSEKANSDQGIPRSKLQHLYYYLLISHQLQPSTTQKQAASAILQSCNSIIGEPEVIAGKPLPNSFTDPDCEHIRQALVSVGLLESAIPTPIPIPLPLPIIENWLKDFQRMIRDWIDQFIGDLRQRIEDYLQDLYEQLLQALEEGLDRFLQLLLQELLKLLEQAIQQCCLGWMLAPLAVLLWQRKRHRSLP